MGLTREQRALPQPAVLPDGQGEEGPDRAGRRRDRARPAEEIKPEIIFVAGDLSDPHGTHRMCKEAIDASRWREIARLPAAPRCGCTAARGRSGPSPTPRGSCRCRRKSCACKIQAIFKHQSQKDSAPFPGQDDREFWQRVERATRTRPRLLDRLGLAEYFAMEAYVVE